MKPFGFISPVEILLAQHAIEPKSTCACLLSTAVQQERGPRKNKGRRRHHGFTGSATLDRSESTTASVGISTAAATTDDEPHQPKNDDLSATKSSSVLTPGEWVQSQRDSVSGPHEAESGLSMKGILSTTRLSAFSKVVPVAVGSSTCIAENRLPSPIHKNIGKQKLQTCITDECNLRLKLSRPNCYCRQAISR